MKRQFGKSLTSVLVASALGAMASTGAAVASEADLQRRIDALQKDLDALKAQSGQPAATRPASSAGETRYQDGYMVWSSADGNYQLKLDGRVQLDVGSVDSKLNSGVVKSDSKFRRVRLAFKTKFHQDWDGELDLDFANNAVDIKDMWLSYSGFDGVGIKFGHFKPYFSLDNMTSSRVATFMESSIAVEVFQPSRRIGLGAEFKNDWVFVGGGVFGDKINTDGEARDNPSMNAQSETFGYAMRGAVRPFWRGEANKAFHVGMSLLNNRPRSNASPSDDRLKFASVVENELTQVEFLDTKQIQGVNNAQTLGLELAYMNGPHVFMAEYFKTKVKLKSVLGDMHPTVAAVWPTIQGPSFDSYYMAYSYFLRGRRVYDPDNAEFAGVTGNNALELTARYSMADLNDSGGYTRNRTSSYRETSRGVQGGKANIATLGLNWYPNRHVKLMVNYMDVRLDKDADADAGSFELANAVVVPIVGNDRLKVLGVRAQFVF